MSMSKMQAEENIVVDLMKASLKDKINKSEAQYLDDFVQRYQNFFKVSQCHHDEFNDMGMHPHKMRNFPGDLRGFGGREDEFVLSLRRSEIPKFIATLLRENLYVVTKHLGNSTEDIQQIKMNQKSEGSGKIKEYMEKQNNEIIRQNKQRDNFNEEEQKVRHQISDIQEKLSKITGQRSDVDIPTQCARFATDVENAFSKEQSNHQSPIIKNIYNSVYLPFKESGNKYFGKTFSDSKQTDLCKQLNESMNNVLREVLNEKQEYSDTMWENMKKLKPEIPHDDAFFKEYNPDVISKEVCLYQDKQTVLKIQNRYGALGRGIHDAREALNRARAAEFWNKTMRDPQASPAGKCKQLLPPRALKAQTICTIMQEFVGKWKGMTDLFQTQAKRVVDQYYDFRVVHDAINMIQQ